MPVLYGVGKDIVGRIGQAGLLTDEIGGDGAGVG